MPLASVPAQISGRNRVWRRVVIDAIRNDPEWKGGNYTKQPQSAAHRGGRCCGSSAAIPIIRQRRAPTLAQADKEIDDYVANYLRTGDANDTLYALESSCDYDPGPGLEKITAPLLAINSADDLVNPPELGLPREGDHARAARRAIMIPLSDKTAGHGTHTLAAVWKQYLVELLRATETRKSTALGRDPSLALFIPPRLPRTPRPVSQMLHGCHRIGGAIRLPLTKTTSWENHYETPHFCRSRPSHDRSASPGHGASRIAPP